MYSIKENITYFVDENGQLRAKVIKADKSVGTTTPLMKGVKHHGGNLISFMHD